MSRSEFLPGEVLSRVEYLSPRYVPWAQWWELRDSNGAPLTKERVARGCREITLDDGKQYLCHRRRGKFKVTRMGESVIETRSGDFIDEPIKFRGHDLCYSMTFTDPPNRWRAREGERVVNCEMIVTDGDVAALSVTVINGARKHPSLGRCVVLENALGPDTPLIASVALGIFDSTFLSGGRG